MARGKASQDEIDRGLQAVVLADGHTIKAAERMRAAGTPIADRTLRLWVEKHPERYAELKDTRNDWTAEQMAQQSEYLAAGYAEAEARLLASVLTSSEEELKKISPNARMQAARNAATGRGISIDKASDLRGRPTRPDAATASLVDVLRKLNSKYSSSCSSTQR